MTSAHPPPAPGAASDAGNPVPGAAPDPRADSNSAAQPTVPTTSWTRVLGSDGPEDPQWRRRVVLLGTVSAAAVTAAMLPAVAPWTLTIAGALAAGLGLWIIELYRTPANRALEAATLLGVGAAGAFLNAAAPQSPGFVLAFFAVSGLGIRFPTRPAAVLSAAVVLMVDAGILATSTQVATSITTNDLGLAFVFVVAAATRSARAAHARTAQLLIELEESRAAQEQAAALAERARLAREIHDILAHSLAGQVMSLEASRLLAERTGADPRLVTEIDRAQRLAKDGLGDTRRAVAALRGDALPGPEQLPALVANAQAAQGLRATLTVHGDPQPLAADAGLCLYRTAQEALTNTAKHAGRGATVQVVLRWEQASVHLDVTDTRRPRPAGAGPEAASCLPSGGYGLTGLRERAELAGGTLDAGPTADGFSVRLTLPTEPHLHEEPQ